MAVYEVGDNGPDGARLGKDSTKKVGFYGATPIAQPSTYSFATSAVGTASSIDVTTAQKAALIAVMNTFSQLGIWPEQA